MLSKLLQKRQNVLVSLWLVALALVLSWVVPAAHAEQSLTGLTIEQARADMPEIRLYVYDDAGSLDGTTPEAYLDGSLLSYTGKQSCDEEGTSYLVMLDVSGSIRKDYFEAAKKQVLALAGQLGKDDKITLITFGDTVELRTAGCQSEQELAGVLSALSAKDQKTRLYEAIGKGLEYARTTDSKERQVMLIVSDGIQDTGSVGVTRQEIEQQLEQASMPVYSFCVDYADKSAQEEFGRFARTTGGEFAVFGASDAASVWDSWLDHLKQAQVLCFAANTNHVDGSQHTLLLKNGAESYTRQIALIDWAPDDTAPQVVSAEYNAKENTLEVQFSEAVLGADDPAAYQIKKGSRTVNAESVSSLGGNSYRVQLPKLKPGSYTVAFSGICDDSMEKNPLEESSYTFKRAITAADVLPFVAGGVLLVVLIVIIVLLARRKKPEPAPAQTPLPPQEIRHDYNYQVQHVDIAPGVEVHSPGADGQTAKVRFEVTSGMQKGQTFETQICKSAIWGRSKEMCDVCLDDHRISRQHCVMELTNGMVRITDLGSQNGTYVNGIRIEQPRVLAKGDTIQLGNTVLRVHSILQ